MALVDYAKEDIDALATVRDLICSANSRTGIITGTQQILTSGSIYYRPVLLASDVGAFTSTFTQPSCPKPTSLPTSDMFWHSAATSGAFSPWILPQHGFCAFINILTGSHWLVIARPKAGQDPSFASTTHKLQQFQPFQPNAHLWNWEAVVLEPGTQLSVRSVLCTTLGMTSLFQDPSAKHTLPDALHRPHHMPGWFVLFYRQPYQILRRLYAISHQGW